MFRASDSDEESPASGGYSHRQRMNIIANQRRAEMKETYDEEMETFPIKPARNTSSSPDSDSDVDADNNIVNNNEGTLANDDLEPPAKKSKGMSVAEKMMAKMGHKQGEGLGKGGQGRVEPVGLSTQRGRVGLGHDAGKVFSRTTEEEWDETQEDKSVIEEVLWMQKCNDHDRKTAATECEEDGWMETGPTKKKIDDETEFCSQERLVGMLQAKDVFDHLSDHDLREARTRANPYETIGGAFFQNRAAMKAANLDKVFDWLFSGEDRKNLQVKNPVDLKLSGTNTDRQKELFYFADVCAGPGGFSEYMLWRKGFFNTKGFGFTLAGRDDFKLEKFNASSPHFFEAFYGTHNDGDVMNPENIDSLEDFIMKGTDGLGVHLMMADGGFSVEGQENIQEILSKRLYLCQLLVSLCIVREGGNFFCKLFDIFTPFSIGLIYLMYVCYDEVCLHKPHTSRPANSERYIICKGLRREYSNRVKSYLKRVNKKLDSLKKAGRDEETDVVSIVPLDVIKENEEFYNYIVVHNEKLALRQEVYLNKYRSFARNQNQIDKDQGDLRDKCLKYWEVPDKARPRNDDLFRQGLNAMSTVGAYYTARVIGDSDLQMKVPPFQLSLLANPGDKQLKYAEFGCTLLTQRTPQQPKILVSSGKNIHVFEQNVWCSYDSTQMRIPDKTILLVELTEYHRLVNSRLVSEKKIIRIIDAAILHGDDVTKLSYANRLRAAEKFCKALHRVVPKVKVTQVRRDPNRAKTRGPPERYTREYEPMELVVAKTFSPADLYQMKDGFQQTREKGVEHLIYKENENFLSVTGVRFAKLLKEPWGIGWSRSKCANFAFQPKEQSIFEQDFEKKECIAPFWEVAFMRRRPEGIRSLQYIWKWEQSLNDDYGPRVILTQPSHKSGPTLQELQAIITETRQRAGAAV